MHKTSYCQSFALVDSRTTKISPVLRAITLDILEETYCRIHFLFSSHFIRIGPFMRTLLLAIYNLPGYGIAIKLWFASLNIMFYRQELLFNTKYYIHIPYGYYRSLLSFQATVVYTEGLDSNNQQRYQGEHEYFEFLIFSSVMFPFELSFHWEFDQTLRSQKFSWLAFPMRKRRRSPQKRKPSLVEEK
uniref:Uncharacterized protein n=1 Tax=Glossina pallidipes TaxID=7398 RepID=A0A1A9ZRG6_GLOPL